MLKMYEYPIVAGHEGVGIIEVVGSCVSHLKVGDRVGVGIYRECCGNCLDCAEGRTNLCFQKKMMFAGTNKGCFSEHMRLEGKFAFKLPEGIKAEEAGPLMCAGATVFAPFRNHTVKPGQSVGVVGIGGLGHLSLQVARAFGCQVYAFSTSIDKEQECRSLGANIFINTTDPASKASVIGKLDFLMMTASGKGVDYKYLMTTLAPGGKMIVMGASGLEDIPVSPVDLILGQKSLCGSAGGSHAIYIDMLKFCALHNIKPIIQTWPVAQINEAIASVKSGKIRYRAVVNF